MRVFPSCAEGVTLLDILRLKHASLREIWIKAWHQCKLIFSSVYNINRSCCYYNYNEFSINCQTVHAKQAKNASLPQSESSDFEQIQNSNLL